MPELSPLDIEGVACALRILQKSCVFLSLGVRALGLGLGGSKNERDPKHVPKPSFERPTATEEQFFRPNH